MPPHREKESLKHLKRQIEFMIFAHQVIADLLRTPNLAGLLEGLKDPDVRHAFAADPLKAAKDAGVILPEAGVSIRVTDFQNSWQVEVQVAHLNSLVVFGLNSVRGFFVL